MVVGIDAQIPGGIPQGDISLPENYPHKYTKNVIVRGQPMVFRPIHPGDNDLMLRLFGTFSKQTIFHRFFTCVRIPPAKLSRFTNIDYQKHMALVSQETKDGSPMLTGSARYNTPKGDEGTAEMAVVIGDPWQGNGIGMALLNYLLIVAHEEGFKKVYGLVHYDNTAMAKVFGKLQKLGIPHRTEDTGTELKFIIDVSNEIPVVAFTFCIT